MATPTTLADYLAPYGLLQRVGVLVEHSECGNPLGPHEAYWDSSFDPPLVVLDRDTAPSRVYNMRPLRPDRGPITSPGVHPYAIPGNWSPGPPSHGGAPHVYERVLCACLPTGHVQKLSVEKVGGLPISFPMWKWGREIDLPVVTI